MFGIKIFKEETELPYPVIYSKRKSIAIQVQENGEILVRAPIGIHQKILRNFVEKKQDWITKHSKIHQKKFAQKKEYNSDEIQQMKAKLQEYILPKVEKI